MSHRRFTVRGAAVLLGLLSGALPIATAQAATAAPAFAPPVTVATDASTYAYGAWAKVTVHVGADTAGAGASATIVADSVNALRPVVKSGAVDAKGDVVAYFHLYKDTTFHVTGWDVAGGWNTVSRSVGVHVGLNERLGGYYRSTHIGRTPYRVFRAWSNVQLGVVVAPDKSTQSVVFRVQEYIRGAWRTISTNRSLPLDGAETGIILLLDNSQTGHLYRFDVHYAGDEENAATDGAWLYYTVRG
ncbi:hypothetical protein [Streptacidiphilus jiangxiensis]|uniref:Uncharacterized protein n=1 Tax=Streptacidiphilus jiangxiensis TaxID=235985 RepID=A0A1H7GFW4_STRJI|nr:hypothetical protein [Streptacidiphilus jiangxiensis]SEK35792.1 hypothetical protein SAMN05414137_101635 [Streptacidiphilus jiangxiensis]